MPSTSSASRTSPRGSGWWLRSARSAVASDSTWRTAVRNVPSPMTPTGRRSRALYTEVRRLGSHSTAGARPGSVPGRIGVPAARRRRTPNALAVASHSGSERPRRRTRASRTSTTASTAAGTRAKGETTHPTSSAAAAISSRTTRCNRNDPDCPARTLRCNAPVRGPGCPDRSSVPGGCGRDADESCSRDRSRDRNRAPEAITSSPRFPHNSLEQGHHTGPLRRRYPTRTTGPLPYQA